jgi:Arc/MetJ-type ribon-helix-helix transcriptional regulator
MRTTVTLEPDVARLLSERARQTRKSFKETLNAAVRSGLGRVTDSSEDREFTIEARPMQLKAGVDAGRLNSLLDDLDADAFIEKNRSDHDRTPPQ